MRHLLNSMVVAWSKAKDLRIEAHTCHQIDDPWVLICRDGLFGGSINLRNRRTHFNDVLFSPLTGEMIQFDEYLLNGCIESTRIIGPLIVCNTRIVSSPRIKVVVQLHQIVLRSKTDEISSALLLMEDIRRENPLGCKKNKKYWNKLPTSTGAGFLLSTVSFVIHLLILHIKRNL